MVTVTVCVGSSCHIKGARNVIARFQELLATHNIDDKVELKGSFCMERCGEGVNWSVNEELITSVSEDDAVAVFQEKVLRPLGIDPTAVADRENRP